MPTTSEGPRQLPQGSDREAHREGSPKAHRTRTMGLKSLPRAQDGRLEARHRPHNHQQALLEEVHENGDFEAVALHRKAKGPLGVVRPERRFLRVGHTPQGQRGFHIQHKWSVITTMRAPYEVVTKSFRILEANGRV